MRHLLILSCLTLVACSQNRFDSNFVKDDPKFLCETTLIERTCKLDKISNSKNEMEIRLEVSYLPTPEFALYVIAKDKNSWIATKYIQDFVHSNDSLVISSYKLTSKKDIEKLYDTLKENKVFTLPDQDDLKINGYVDDGNSYALTFKVGNKLRKYYFNNPDIYQENFKQVKEFKNYSNIANTFYNSFDKK